MRIFTYGCSVTDYNWPTWADIICYEYQDQIPCHNYGNSGTGNTAIAQHVAASHLEHTFTDDDTLKQGILPPIHFKDVVDYEYTRCYIIWFHFRASMDPLRN